MYIVSRRAVCKTTDRSAALEPPNGLGGKLRWKYTARKFLWKRMLTATRRSGCTARWLGGLFVFEHMGTHKRNPRTAASYSIFYTRRIDGLRRWQLSRLQWRAVGCNAKRNGGDDQL